MNESLTGSGWGSGRDRKLRPAAVECQYVGTFSGYQWDIVSAPSITDQITMTKTTIRQRQIGNKEITVSRGTNTRVRRFSANPGKK